MTDNAADPVAHRRAGHGARRAARAGVSAPNDRCSARQTAQLTFLLDALGGVPLSDAERQSLEWLAGWEIHTVQNIAAVLRRARLSTADADPAAAVSWEDRVSAAIEAVFPARVAAEILTDDAIGALAYRLREQCDALNQPPAQVLGALPVPDREFCAHAQAPAAFLAARVRDGG